MRQRLGFAQVLLGSPDILFLDEPTTGLDPEGTREFYEIVGELKSEGVTAVLATHNLAEIQDRVDKLALMQMGRVRASGTVQSLRDELKLPLGITLALRNGAATRLEQALAPFNGCEVDVHGARASVRCARDHKMAVLRAITALDDAITDMNVHEPSLEDVFLGYTELKGS
jgi:Cu-processing system ATP-binding protein